MNRIWRMFVIVILYAACCEAARAQALPPTILEIDLENRVNYVSDVSDVSKYATDPNVTTPIAARNFRAALQLNDIVAVNGRPAKGINVVKFQSITISTTATSGQAIADTNESIVAAGTYQILKPDGTLIGSIMTSGLGGGDTPPGAPSAGLQGDATIVGGTGAFLGVRGQSVVGQQRTATRNASVTEDPANRRRNGGGAARVILSLIPMSRPEIIVNSIGPAVVHANDFTQVTAAKPATAGELLVLYATGLGPTKPGVDPGKPFTTSPQQIVNSPVELTVNGAPAQVLYAGGFPGSVDGYHVSFRLPPGIGSGQVSLQLTSAFISGPEVKIAVQ